MSDFYFAGDDYVHFFVRNMTYQVLFMVFAYFFYYDPCSFPF